jgi:hypothetical protein
MSDKPIDIELERELLALDGESASFYVDRPVTDVRAAGSPPLLAFDYTL